MIAIANRYWVGDSGNWSSTFHWSTTSGGASGASEPTGSDNVYFDANSFSTSGKTVTINVSANCLDMDWTGTTNSPTLTGSSQLNIYGSLTLIPDMTLTYSGSITFRATSSGKTIFSAGKTMPSISFDGTNGEWILQDDLYMSGLDGISFNADGTLRTNNKSISVSGFAFWGTGFSLYLGSSIVSLSRSWARYSGADWTVDAGTSLIKMTGSGSYSFQGHGKTYYNIEFVGSGNILYDSNIFNDLKIDAGKTLNIGDGTTQTVNTLTAIGSSGNVITIQSNSSGTPATISKSSGVVEVDYCSIKDITATGEASFYADNSTNISGNSGWYFVTNRITVADSCSGADAASIVADITVADGHEHTQLMAIGIGYTFDPTIDTGYGLDATAVDVVANVFWQDIFDAFTGVDGSLTVTGMSTIYQYIADGHQTTQLVVGVGAVFDPSLDTGYGADYGSVLASLTAADTGRGIETARVLASLTAADIGHGIDVGLVAKAFWLIDSHNVLQPLGVFVLRDSKEELLPTTRDNTDAVPGRHGDLDFGSELEARVMEFKVHINTTPEEKTALKRTLAAYLNPLLGVKPLIDSHDIEKTYYVKYAGNIDLTNYVNAMQFTIPFKACDPIIYGTFEQTQTGSGTITNEGTLESPLIITITGAVTNPSVVIGTHTLTYTGTLTSSDTLVIDTDALTCTLNGVNAIVNLTGLTTDVVLAVGDTVVTAPANGTTVLTWYERFI